MTFHLLNIKDKHDININNWYALSQPESREVHSQTELREILSQLESREVVSQSQLQKALIQPELLDIY